MGLQAVKFNLESARIVLDNTTKMTHNHPVETKKCLNLFGDIMNRSELDNLTGEELRKLIDPDIEEYEDYLPEIKNINNAWKSFDRECDLGKSRWEEDINFWYTYEKEMQERRSVWDTLEEDSYEQFLQYHHEVVETPYWKQCVDRLEELL